MLKWRKCACSGLWALLFRFACVGWFRNAVLEAVKLGVEFDPYPCCQSLEISVSDCMLVHCYTVTGDSHSRAENRVKWDRRIDWLSFAHALSAIITNCVVFDGSTPLGEARIGYFIIMTNSLNVVTGYLVLDEYSKYVFHARFPRLTCVKSRKNK